jgi:excisionase family DNA binding protein
MDQRLANRDRTRLLSTGKVAKALSVTPDTVLKWVKSGRLPAIRTAGGHYRVAREDVDRLVASDPGPNQARPDRKFVHCWEFYGTDSGPNTRCLECLVYRAQAIRCYEMSNLAVETGYVGAYCKTSCDECEYYQDVVRRRRRVLIVSGSADLRRRLRDDDDTSLEVRFADSEYECAAACADFKPDYVVIDGALSKRERSSLCSHVSADPRIPGVTVILAMPESRSPVTLSDEGADRAVPRTLDLVELERHITRLEVKPKIVV